MDCTISINPASI